MTTDLLQEIGFNLYGEQWQAALCRDLGVGDRTMRRWVAHQNEIPEGVWRDISLMLDSELANLGYINAKLKEHLGMIEVHSFKWWDGTRDDYVNPPLKSTAARIALIRGEIIPGTAEWVPAAKVDDEGRVKS